MPIDNMWSNKQELRKLCSQSIFLVIKFEHYYDSKMKVLPKVTLYTVAPGVSRADGNTHISVK